jgi:hypothetical protein
MLTSAAIPYRRRPAGWSPAETGGGSEVVVMHRQCATGQQSHASRGRCSEACTSEATEPPSLPRSWGSAFPPVAWWLVPDHRRRNLHLEYVAELPQLLRRPGVLEENVINVERVELAGTVAIDGLPNAGDKFSQLCLVVVRDHQTRRAPLRLAGHAHEATQASSLSAASWADVPAASDVGVGAGTPWPSRRRQRASSALNHRLRGRRCCRRSPETRQCDHRRPLR